MVRLISNFYYGLVYSLKTYNPFMISTMGRSGTWYNREFFYFYNKLLNGEQPGEIRKKMIENKTKIKYLLNLNKKNFGFNSVFIQHYLCPGFEENYKSSFRKEWDKLVFYSKHIPAPYTKLMIDKKIEKKVSPFINKDTKIIYYVRNPLDQNVAYFDAVQNNIDEDLNYYYDFKLRKKKKFSNINDFLRNAGIDMYLKHYLSFELVRKQYPSNILILHYENMVNDPVNNFKKVLNFIGHKFQPIEFNQAIKLSSKESIVSLENAYGEAISGAFKNKSDRQLKDAMIGKWKNKLKNEDIEYIKKRFEEFNIDYKIFTYE